MQITGLILEQTQQIINKVYLSVFFFLTCGFLSSFPPVHGFPKSLRRYDGFFAFVQIRQCFFELFPRVFDDILMYEPILPQQIDVKEKASKKKIHLFSKKKNAPKTNPSMTNIILVYFKFLTSLFVKQIGFMALAFCFILGRHPFLFAHPGMTDGFLIGNHL